MPGAGISSGSPDARLPPRVEVAVNRYVQYGCGWTAPESWDNFDSSPTLRFERVPLIGRMYTRNARRFPANVRYGDVTRGLPVADQSCAGIFCSHVLEHLALADFERALAHTFRYLRPGGIFRLIVPDLRIFATKYLESADPLASCTFLEDTGLGWRERPRGLGGLLKNALGGSAHLWMWDARSMQSRLESHGFRAIRRAVYGDSSDARFAEVEESGRFEDSLAMECVK